MFATKRPRWSSAFRQRPLLRIVSYTIVLFLCLYFLLPPPSRNYLSVPSVATDLPPENWNEAASKVKSAFLHAFNGYRHFAGLHDELKPLSNTYSDKFNGWALTLFDSLDTMLLMELNDEFDWALGIIKDVEFTLAEGSFAPYFETVIRYLGGLLSGYALSQNKTLLDRADELATKLDPVFNTTSGLPFYGVNPTTKAVTGSDIGVLAEIGTLQLEYTYLAKLTSKREHFARAKSLLQTLEHADLQYTDGMLPVRWNLTTGQPHDSHISVGAQADSAHEYLLKQFLMTARTDNVSLIMYLRATTHIITNLLYLSPTRHLLYVTDQLADRQGRRHQTTHIFEHLSCFLPGLLALGAHLLPLDDLNSLGITAADIGGKSHGNAGKNFAAISRYDLRKLHLWAAEGLAETCYLTYADQPTGLGPDEVLMNVVEEKGWFGWRNEQRTIHWMDAMKTWKRSGSRGPPPGVGGKKPVVYLEEGPEPGTKRMPQRDYVIRKPDYLLRPETVESLYILWRVTGDPKWRLWGKSVFESLEKEAKTSSGYASLSSVVKSPATLTDDMPSYFLAETLKYLYLMFTHKDLIPLDKWVFNTEAHPFPVFAWSAEELQYFNISGR